MSDILIKNTEMPKYCYECPTNNPENCRCQLGVETYGLDVPKHCPLVEVKPHGRTIDADELLKTIEKLRDEPMLTYTQFSDGVLKAIKSAPTILEASNG